MLFLFVKFFFWEEERERTRQRWGKGVMGGKRGGRKEEREKHIVIRPLMFPMLYKIYSSGWDRRVRKGNEYLLSAFQ